MSIPSFDDYLATLGRIAKPADPTVPTAASLSIQDAAASLARLAGAGAVDRTALVEWVRLHPSDVPVLGLAVGVSQEKLKNSLRDAFDSSNWVALARSAPADLVDYLDRDFDLVRLLGEQLGRSYGFGDVLVARAGSRVTAISAGASGRRVEDEIEAVARDLGLPCRTRTRFIGRGMRTAPCDLVLPDGQAAEIVVAAKGFDSTGSKLTDAVREIEEMADVRLPRQAVLVVVDGIGWKSRQADLRRIHELWSSNQIDGMYTLATLDVFRADLERLARVRGILPEIPAGPPAQPALFA